MKTNILKFKNVKEINGMYICPQWNYEDVIKTYNNKSLCINFDISKETDYTEEVKEIMNKILYNELLPSMITFNVSNQEQLTKYNKETKELEIIVENNVAIVDGIKKILALNMAVKQAKERGTKLEGSFLVQINNL